MALVYVGEATFVDKDPVDVGEGDPREWTPRYTGSPIHWYVQFPSLERASYGLALLKKGPKSKWLDQEEVGETRFNESIAQLWEFADALKYLEKKKEKRYAFEENPFVEVKNEDDYEKAFLAWKGIEDASEMTWQERERIMKYELAEESGWRGPGVYDFRDMTRHAKSVGKYEIESMDYWAKEVLDSAYDEDWEKAMWDLIRRNTE